jgi:hypothetical protein
MRSALPGSVTDRFRDARHCGDLSSRYLHRRVVTQRNWAMATLIRVIGFRFDRRSRQYRWYEIEGACL